MNFLKHFFSQKERCCGHHRHRHHSIFFQLSPSSLYTYFENNNKVWHQYSTRIFENINLKDILTFCNMPHIKVMSCFSQIFSNPLYNLDMTICHQCFDFDIFGLKISCTSNKAFLLHVWTALHFTAL